jgi:hypothetical protein
VTVGLGVCVSVKVGVGTSDEVDVDEIIVGGREDVATGVICVGAQAIKNNIARKHVAIILNINEFTSFIHYL